jgi:hypothetical protein
MRIFAHYDSTGTIRALITVEARDGAIATHAPARVVCLGVEGLKLDGRQIKSGAPGGRGDTRDRQKSQGKDTSAPARLREKARW